MSQNESYLLTEIKEIVTPVGSTASNDEHQVKTLKNQALWIEKGVIRALGPQPQVLQEAPPQLPRISAEHAVLLPGCVDPHTHLVFGGHRPDEFNRRLRGETYQDIAQAGGGIKATVKATRASSIELLKEKASKNLDDFLRHGTTTLEAKTGYGLDEATELKQLEVMDRLAEAHPVELHQTFMGAHELPEEWHEKGPMAYLRFLLAEVLPQVAKRKSVRYVDIFCEKGVFELKETRAYLSAAKDMGFLLRVHADELYPLGGAGVAADLGAVTADHLIHTSDVDRKKMAQSGTMPVLLPGTSLFLRSPFANAQGFIRDGCPIALSTDFNPGSSHTTNPFAIMALACFHLGMTFEQALLGLTLNAACSLGQGHRLGSIEVGKQADFLLLDVPTACFVVYQWGINHVRDVFKAGVQVVKDGRCLVPQAPS